MARDFATIIAAILLSLVLSGSAIAAPIKSAGTVDVFFSPNDGATEAVVKEIRLLQGNCGHY